MSTSTKQPQKNLKVRKTDFFSLTHATLPISTNGQKQLYSDTSKIYGYLATIILTDSYPPPLVPEPDAPDEVLDNTTNPSGIIRETLQQELAAGVGVGEDDCVLFSHTFFRKKENSVEKIARCAAVDSCTKWHRYDFSDGISDGVNDD
jgi:hypothetical protein